MTPWSRVALGEVVRQVAREEVPTPGTAYRQLGVRLWGEGAYERATIDGSETRYRVLFRTEEHDLVVNKIRARNGSVAVTTADLAGAFGSAEFPMFTIESGLARPRWIHWLTKHHEFWASCDESSRGTSGKNRMRIPAFLRIEIPLPAIDQQDRIVTVLDAASERIQRARSLRSTAMQSLAHLRSALLDALFPVGGGGVVGDVVSIQSGYAFKSDWFSGTGVRLVRNVNVSHGTLDWSQTARIPEERRGEFSRFHLNEGDILVSLDRPIIATGTKVARVRAVDVPSLLLQRVARANIRTDTLDADYLYAWLKSPRFSAAIDPGRSNGIPHISPKDIERIPLSVPRMAEQRRIAEEAKLIETRISTLTLRMCECSAALDALLPSLLDRAFRGEL